MIHKAPLVTHFIANSACIFFSSFPPIHYPSAFSHSTSPASCPENRCDHINKHGSSESNQARVNTVYQHQAMQKLAKKFGWNYTRKKNT